MTKIILNIDGMHCAACSATIERAVKKIEGVDSVSVNLNGGNALVEFDESKTVTEDIIKAVNNAGFIGSLPQNNSKSENREKAEINLKHSKKMLIFSLIFGLPLFYISMGHMLGAPLPDFISPDKNALIYAVCQLVLSVLVMFSGYDIFKSAFRSAMHRNANMDTLISMGSAAAFSYSIYSLIMIAKDSAEHVHQLYFESAGMIITFILIGRYLESASKRKTNSAVEKLMDLSPSTALITVDGVEKEVSTNTLRKGDVICVKSGMSIPVDGIVLSGNGTVDESMLTGESMPVEKCEGNTVSGGTINKNGYITVKVTEELDQSAPARIAEYVNRAQATKAPIANLANKIASVFVPAIILIAFVSSAIWLLSGESFGFAVRIFVCVLVIACPCSLGLATPTALTVAMGKSASKGILVKSGEALQRMNEIDTVVFDKTGTITKGKPEVTEISVFNNFVKDEALKYLSSAEAKSEHPLALAIKAYSQKENVSLLGADNCRFLTGMGIECTVNSRKIICGNEKLMNENHISTQICKETLRKNTESGKTVILLAVDGQIAAAVSISDPIKDNASEIIKALNKENIRTVMLTGDNKNAAKAIADTAGINEVYAELMPDDKLSVILKLKDKGNKVAMVGDGINDAPSLTAADVGIAIGTGTDIAIESADIVLIGGQLEGVLTSVKNGKKTMRIIKQNLFWAFAYNIICIPLAAGLLYAFGGILLNPMVAAAAMSLSSVTVVSNSLRLRK